MSQEQRNGGNEQGQPGRAGYERGRQRPEGFEGMNYEQPRPPFQPRPRKETPPENNEPGNGDKQDSFRWS